MKGNNMRMISILTGCLMLLAVYSAQADLLWSEDFSDVSDWSVISDPGGGSTITSDGNLGLFYVNSNNTEAAFGPNTGVAPFVPKSDDSSFTMSFDVDSLTSSTSYDIALDEFDSSHTYLSTIWQVFPSSGTSTFTGSTNINISGLSYNANTAYLMPKIDVHTGNGAQTVRFDSMQFTTIPEPGPLVLMLLGWLPALVYRHIRHGNARP